MCQGPPPGCPPPLSRITAQSKSLGTDAYMSPQRFHAHLQMLSNMVPWMDGSTRTWINAFFFCAAAMVPPSHYLIMSAEQMRTHTASLYPKDGNAGISEYAYTSLSNFEMGLSCVGAVRRRQGSSHSCCVRCRVYTCFRIQPYLILRLGNGLLKCGALVISSRGSASCHCYSV